jgi:hypothetical protein
MRNSRYKSLMLKDGFPPKEKRTQSGRTESLSFHYTHVFKIV